MAKHSHPFVVRFPDTKIDRLLVQHNEIAALERKIRVWQESMRVVDSNILGSFVYRRLDNNTRYESVQGKIPFQHAVKVKRHNSLNVPATTAHHQSPQCNQ